LTVKVAFSKYLRGYILKNKIIHSENLNILKTHAEELSALGEDFETNWLFVYEVLSQNKLSSDWKAMKKAKVSFVKDMEWLKKVDEVTT
jgi:hypothetical protein